jgi:hypothetical protein
VNYYSLIESCSQNVAADLLHYARSASTSSWYTIPEQPWLLPIPADTFSDCPQVERLLDRYGDRTRMSIIRMEPNSYYAWHVDTLRSVGINMMLNCFGDSFSGFGKLVERPLWNQVERLMYEPCALYLFNASEYHFGANFSNDTRYLVTCSLIDCTYDEALAALT